MCRLETKIEMEVKILCNKSMQTNAQYQLENFVKLFCATASAICVLKTEHLGLKPYRNS
jgi:hypothetical protein